MALCLNGWSFKEHELDPLGELECEDDSRIVPISNYIERGRDFNCVTEHRVWSIWSGLKYILKIRKNI